MKANELMIGDWVKIRDLKKPIKKISCICNTTGMIKFWDENLYATPFENILPILLTGEILKKNGFKKSEIIVEWVYKNNDVYMIYKPFPLNQIKIKNDKGSVVFYCEYVHEFQHALRLCGIDKEIEL